MYPQGRACSTHKRAGSPTCRQWERRKAEMESAVRFSFSELQPRKNWIIVWRPSGKPFPCFADMPVTNKGEYYV